MAEGNPKLDRARFHNAEHLRQDYVAIIPQEHALEATEDPAYWSTIANQCRTFGRIEARAEDGTWIAEYVIKEVGRQFVIVQRLNLYSLTTADVGQTQVAKQYEVSHRGQHHKWSVKRLSDSAVVHSGEETREAAEGWLREHMKAVAR